MSLLRSKSCGLRPVLTLDVVDDGRLRPRQQCWNDETDALPRAGRREDENVFGTIVLKITQALRARVVPATHINALSRIEQTSSPNVLLGCPTRRTMNIFRIAG